MIGRFLKALALLPLLYLAAGALLGSIPRGPAAAEPDDAVTIYVATNGVHTGVLVPASGYGVDWRELVRPEHLADPRHAGRWLWFGWGDRDFYLNTPTWAEVSPLTVLRAATGSGDTLIHVDHLPGPYEDARPVRISRAQYQRLSAALRRSFALGEDGRAAPIRGYGPADIFYPARGHYSALFTCNAWTGDILAEAGIRIGLWTPFSATVMQWF
jgi:uncharacterized protein (TIGR02117 family)